MTKDEAMKKFGRWSRIEGGFIFRRKDGKWDCCTVESPIGRDLATLGAGQGRAANITEFEAMSQEMAAGFPDQDVSQVTDADAPTPRAPKVRAPKRSRPRLKRTLILIGLLLLIGGIVCFWTGAGMGTDIDALIGTELNQTVTIGLVAAGVGFLLVLINLFRFGRKAEGEDVDGAEES